MEGVLPSRSPLTLVQALIRGQELLSPSGRPVGPLGPWQPAASCGLALWVPPSSPCFPSAGLFVMGFLSLHDVQRSELWHEKGMRHSGGFLCCWGTFLPVPLEPPSIRTLLPPGGGTFPPDEPCYWEPSQPQEGRSGSEGGWGWRPPQDLQDPPHPLLDMSRQCPPACILGRPLCWAAKTLRGGEHAGFSVHMGRK